MILRAYILTVLCLLAGLHLCAQRDSLEENRIDSLIKNSRGLIGKMAQNLLVNEDSSDQRVIQRNDAVYRKYENRIIRKVIVRPLDFGSFSSDTSKSLNRKLANLANALHVKSKQWAIRNQLFFREGDKVSPYLLANNERYLRDLSYLQEARIQILPVSGTRDSVDVIVVTKDILSLGGSGSLPSATVGTLMAEENNLGGWGDRLAVEVLADRDRRDHFDIGGQYVKRNILGTFIDGSAGFSNFNFAFNSGGREEQLRFVRFVKPLVNPYMRWTYAIAAELHTTVNQYSDDSIYNTETNYRYRIYDAWAGYNLSSNAIASDNEYDRLRFLISGRVLDQHFYFRPNLISDRYYFRYVNLTGFLASVSVFRQNFYKTRFIYGFGRNEDLPEGIDASLTGGYTIKDGLRRNYYAARFSKSGVTRKEGFFNYSLAAGSFFRNFQTEDIELFANMDYFTRLRWINARWQHRMFLNASVSRQYKTVLSEPLVLESRYGLNGFDNLQTPGNLRATVSAESVFYSPWSLLFFKFAPFCFGSATLFKNSMSFKQEPHIYTGFGGGIRTRNESLIFGTIEIRGIFYPVKDLMSNRFVVQFNTNLRFKYNQNFIRRPEFMQMN